MNKNMRTCLAAVLAGCLLLGAVGCGKKSWPTPRENKYRFAFAEVRGRLENGCLKISARLIGQYENLNGLTLELAPVDQEGYCPGCPFLPERSIDLGLTAASVHLRGSHLEIDQCGLAPDKGLRFRLTGTNYLEQQPAVRSDVLQVNP